MKPASYKPKSRFRFWAPLNSQLIPVLTAVTLLTLYPVANSAEVSRPSTAVAGNAAIVIGFVGGFVHHDDPRHSEVQLAKRLSAEYGSRAHVAMFENRHREDAHAEVLRWLDTNRNGLTEDEKRAARIVLYGHSWGATAVLALARELERDHVPVLLTIQVDSISKLGLNDHLVPGNVARAVNFYQTGGPLHGNRQIVAADPARTQILGDFRFDYRTQPEPCSAYPWFARHFLKGHTSIECDPNVWSRVEALIGEYLLPTETQIAGQKAGLRDGGGVE
jgi:pimeloyl-ACP methyl ester carboxylesterase